MTLQVMIEENILKTLKSLPPNKLEEVLNFAEYLKGREKPVKRKVRRLELPTFQMGKIAKGALDRSALYGECLDRKLD